LPRGLYLANIMDRYRLLHTPLTIALHIGLYLSIMMDSYRGPQTAVTRALHGGLYLAIIMDLCRGPQTALTISLHRGMQCLGRASVQAGHGQGLCLVMACAMEGHVLGRAFALTVCALGQCLRLGLVRVWAWSGLWPGQSLGLGRARLSKAMLGKASVVKARLGSSRLG
jgi:hypothetical protein